jgi:hypothetical protein
MVRGLEEEEKLLEKVRGRKGRRVREKVQEKRRE